MKTNFIYDATIVDVHDGDTITAIVDLGFNLSIREKFRFYGINAPELKVRNPSKGNKMEENPYGTITLNFVKEILTVGKQIQIQTIKDKKEKFGRYLGKIFYKDENGRELCLNDVLLEKQLAVEMVY